MFYQVRDNPLTICFFDAMSFRPFLFDIIIIRQVTRVDSTFPILIVGHEQDGTYWYVDSYQDGLDVFAMFKSKEPHVNNINNIYSQ